MIYYQKGYYVSMAFLNFSNHFSVPFFSHFFSHFSVYLFSAISQRHFRLFLLFYVFFSTFAFPMCSSILFPIPMVSYSDGFLFR